MLKTAILGDISWEVMLTARSEQAYCILCALQSLVHSSQPHTPRRDFKRSSERLPAATRRRQSLPTSTRQGRLFRGATRTKPRLLTGKAFASANPPNRRERAVAAGRLRENTTMRRPPGGALKLPYLGFDSPRRTQAAFFSAFRHLVQRSSLLVNFL
jgi:hypothetical protein